MTDNHNDRTFEPIIEDGQIVAGGLRIAEVDASGRLVFADPYQRRRYARGTDNVPVDVLELLEALLRYYGRGAG